MYNLEATKINLNCQCTNKRTVETSEDYPNENEQRLFVQSLL